MSKTDKTRPYRVKMVDSKSNYREAHNHASRPLRDANGDFVRVPIPGKFWGERQATRIVHVPFVECDLPAEPTTEGDWHSCRWESTRSFDYSGQAKCGCPVCADQVDRKNKVRRERQAGKRQARNWKDEY